MAVRTDFSTCRFTGYPPIRPRTFQDALKCRSPVLFDREQHCRQAATDD